MKGKLLVTAMAVVSFGLVLPFRSISKLPIRILRIPLPMKSLLRMGPFILPFRLPIINNCFEENKFSVIFQLQPIVPRSSSTVVDG